MKFITIKQYDPLSDAIDETETLINIDHIISLRDVKIGKSSSGNFDYVLIKIPGETYATTIPMNELTLMIKRA